MHRTMGVCLRTVFLVRATGAKCWLDLMMPQCATCLTGALFLRGSSLPRFPVVVLVSLLCRYCVGVIYGSDLCLALQQSLRIFLLRAHPAGGSGVGKGSEEHGGQDEQVRFR